MCGSKMKLFIQKRTIITVTEEEEVEEEVMVEEVDKSVRGVFCTFYLHSTYSIFSSSIL